MLLGDIINGKEKSHLVLVHGECFSPHLLIYTSEDILKKSRKLARSVCAVHKALSYDLSVCNSSADTVNQNGKPLLCCFVRSLLER